MSKHLIHDPTRPITVTKDQRAGPVARMIDAQAIRDPADFFLWTAVGSMVGSVALQILRRPHASLFVGQWVPTLLMLGLYRKIAVNAGSDSIKTLEPSPVLH